MLDLTAELDKLTALPEGADSATLEPHWCRLLDLFDTHPGHGVAFAECLHELALRQWHTYERPGEEVQRRVTVWITRVWSLQSTELVDCCAGVIGSLGLDSCVELVRSAAEDPSTDPHIARELAAELATWGSPLDPWRGLE